ncbi:MAG: hypothetical protein J7497_00265 [Chitinophagaceae bacterium]|nr:hypothetical protein [Chitinophagaceae bacterium]
MNLPVEVSDSSFAKTTTDSTSQMGDGADPETAYDYNGNIKAMTQWGIAGGAAQAIDKLSYTYRTGSNKLAKVTDEINTKTYQLGDFNDGTNTDDDYDYDANGNLTKDQNKNISSISYNVLNLPEYIAVAGKGAISYQYDAAGNKLSKKVTEGSATKQTDYLGGAIFEDNVLQHVAMEEGRLRPSGTTAFITDYFLKDHLGNVRAMVQEDGTLLEETAYYPFGLKMSGISLTNATPSLHNKNKTFQGQKFDDELGLNYYSFKYRNHDPQIGRFTEIDPLANDYVYNSAYAFSENAVTGHIELEGLEKIKFSDVWNNKASLVDYIASGDVLFEIADASYEVNPLRHGTEALTGRTIMSNFTAKTDRAGSVIEFGMSVVAPELKVEGGILKAGLGEVVEKKVIQASENVSTKLGGKITEPKLPAKTIAKDGNVEIVHYTKSGDHGPAHMHVKGGGAETKIGQNGKPIKGSSELSNAQKKVVEDNKAEIRKAGKQIMKWYNYNNQ